MKKLGFLVNNLGPSQLMYFLTKHANASLLDDPGMDIIVFYSEMVRPALPMNFATMPLYEAHSYDGCLVSTDIETTKTMFSFPGPRKRIFYVWDLEWIRQHARSSYREMWSAYTQIGLIARSDEHKRIIEDVWNTRVLGVVDDFDMKALLGVIGE